MENSIELLKKNISPLRKQLVNHKIYSAIQSPADLGIFMEHHVFAVWDFMSLLKKLQKELTCVDIPWIPKGNPSIRFLINEIVTGEESDVDQQGSRISHFELYMEAMKQCNADFSAVNKFLSSIERKCSVQESLDNCGARLSVKNFVMNTFGFIETNDIPVIASVFTFGREDLIPDMFRSMVNDIDKKFPGTVSIFKYYLERHIEVDGDHHTPLALNMTQTLLGNDSSKWHEAEEAVKSAFCARINLWDAATDAIEKSKMKKETLIEA